MGYLENMAKPLDVLNQQSEEEQITLESERLAWVMKWPEPLQHFSEEERTTMIEAGEIKQGSDTLIWHSKQTNGQINTRGFVRGLLQVPLHEADGSIYSCFFEVDREAYIALQHAFKNQESAQVTGRVANQLPYLSGVLGVEVILKESGQNTRVRVIDSPERLILQGPDVL